MRQDDRQAYLKWWKRMAWWLLVWFVLVFGVACISASPAAVFRDASGLPAVAYVALVYGAATSPWMAFAFWGYSSLMKASRAIDELLRPWVEEGLDWGWFWGILLGAPLFMTAVCWDMAHSFEVLSMLAGIDAVLVVAVVVDNRSIFALMGWGAPAQTQTTIRLALLCTIAVGVIVVVNGAIVAKTSPPAGVKFDLALAVALAYGFFACIAAVVTLTLNAAARLMDAHAEARERADRPPRDSTEALVRDSSTRVTAERSRDRGE